MGGGSGCNVGEALAHDEEVTDAAAAPLLLGRQRPQWEVKELAAFDAEALREIGIVDAGIVSSGQRGAARFLADVKAEMYSPGSTSSMLNSPCSFAGLPARLPMGESEMASTIRDGMGSPDTP